MSVVIPTHDRPEMVRQALRCVLAQEGIDLQAIVVDDGSAAPVEEGIASLDDARVTVVRHDTPRGVANSRNAGATVAEGEWIAVLDDDDLWAPTKLARQVESTGPAGAAWAYAGAVEVDEDGILLGGERPPSPQVLETELRRRNPMPAGCSNVVVRAEAFRSTGGFDPALRHLADWDMWLRLIREGRPACVPEPLVAYRIHPSQATLDTAGMLAEGRVLRDRHGVELTSIRRWLAWSQLRRGRRWPAALAYARSAASGDLTSLARAAAAMLHPAPTSLRGRPLLAEDIAWAEGARPWLREALTGS